MIRHFLLSPGAALLMILAGCAADSGRPADPGLGCSPQAAGQAGARSGTQAAAAAAGPVAEVSAGLGPAFETKYARFEPARFEQLPGWTDDSQHEGLTAFRQSCAALGKKAVWSDLCEQSSHLTTTDTAAWRGFFEQNFYAYSVLQPDSTSSGLITGYYEPLLSGSRYQTPRYAYPVYGTPSDLLFVDAHAITGASRQWFTLADRKLTPAESTTPGAHEYSVSLANVEAGVRDKKYRVRIEGDSILPFWSRQEIEGRDLRAPVLAWVDDPYALYSMQVQGSGKIRLMSGETIRVAFGEQNGYPFLPQGAPQEVASNGRTRGLKIADGSASAAPAAAPPNTDVADIIAALKARPDAVHVHAAAGVPKPAPPAPQTAAAPAAGQSADVAAMIAALKKPHGGAPQSAGQSAGAAASPAAPASAADAGEPAGASHAGPRTNIPDPSYTFFRRVPDGPQGPLGALGVSLTAGRSIAVDPRTTPLGYPVFLSTDGADGAPKSGRLMFAQDTGGAIRGAVRADYFWGFGPQAGQMASSMKAPGHMWLLLPKALKVAAADSSLRTRGAGPAPLSECVVADDQNCVEE